MRTNACGREVRQAWSGALAPPTKATAFHAQMCFGTCWCRVPQALVRLESFGLAPPPVMLSEHWCSQVQLVLLLLSSPGGPSGSKFVADTRTLTDGGTRTRRAPLNQVKEKVVLGNVRHAGLAREHRVGLRVVDQLLGLRARSAGTPSRPLACSNIMADPAVMCARPSLACCHGAGGRAGSEHMWGLSDRMPASPPQARGRAVGPT